MFIIETKNQKYKGEAGETQSYFTDHWEIYDNTDKTDIPFIKFHVRTKKGGSLVKLVPLSELKEITETSDKNVE